MIDTVLTLDLYPMLVSAMAVTTWGDRDDISVRKEKKGTLEPEIQTGSQRLPLYGGSDPGLGCTVKNI